MPTLTVDQRKEVARHAQEELARRSCRDYVVHVHRGNYSHFKHTEYISNELEPIANGTQRYLLIEIPPRHGKKYDGL